MSLSKHGIRSARSCAFTVIVATAASLLAAGRAAAEERKFVVMLAHSPKSFATGGVPGLPPGGLTSAETIRKLYFDRIDPNIDSFAEYWEEISYGDVVVTGKVPEWVTLPWAFDPAPPNADPRPSPVNYINLRTETMFSEGVFLPIPIPYAYGAGEDFCDAYASWDTDTTVTTDRCGALIIIDLVGDRDGAAPPARGPGTPDFDAVGINVWTPGERFIDIDDDERWDGIDEKNDLMCHGPDGCRNACSRFVCSVSGTACQINSHCPAGEVCIPAGSDLPCESDADCDVGSRELCGDPPGSGPRGCKSPGCGDLRMACVDWDDDGDCKNCSGEDPTTRSGCTIPEFIPCTTDSECDPLDASGANPGFCVRLPGHCSGDIPLTCSSNQECPGSDVCIGVCAPTTCAMPTDGCDPDLPECCDPSASDFDDCVRDGGVSAATATRGVTCGDPINCCEFDDFDEDSVVDVVEPFEDFMIRWNPQGSTPGTVWVPVDQDYILNNYPGDARTLVARSSGSVDQSVFLWGNRYYDPPDLFVDATNSDGDPVSTKMMQDASVQRTTYVTIPKPGALRGVVRSTSGYAKEEPWYEQFWRDRYHTVPPPWPGGDFPSGFNSPRMRPFDPKEPVPPVVRGTPGRRYFNPDRGGWNGMGVGTEDDHFRVLVVGLGLENEPDEVVLPEEKFGYYDGWVEHDDLPSSKYHSQGDKRLGEITSPSTDTITLDGEQYAAIFGADLGDHDPSTPSPNGDTLGVAAGPYAVNIHGEKGFDAGDVCILEWLTWRTDGRSPTVGYRWELDNGRYHPFAGPSSPLTGGPVGFRDYNLDGMIDQGEVRPERSENYSTDSNPYTADDGTHTDYPFNRRRMVEDIVEALDSSVDWDDFIDANSMRAALCPRGLTSWFTWTFDPEHFDDPDYYKLIPAQGFVSGIVLVPPGAYSDQDLFPMAPWYYPVHNEDNDDPTYMMPDWPADPFDPSEVHRSFNLHFHDLVICQSCREFPAAVGYAAHEYLHTWEGFPDLYDYDVFGDGTDVINCPIGVWDIMAGSRGNSGLVHPVPILKEKPCTEWVKTVDLTTVLTPGVPTTITLPPAELVRDESYYFLENDERLGERYYFWSVEAQDSFDSRFPGEWGMLMLHTDVGANPEALPLQQRTAPFNYLIVQADGNNDLQACSSTGNDGDAGDVWPGSEGATEFNFNTDPPAEWTTLNRWTGLDVTDIVPDGSGSVALTLSWVPTSIPSLRFVNPPGGESGGGPYQVRFKATDVHGGTWIRFFYGQTRCGGTGAVCASDQDCSGNQTCTADMRINSDGSNFVGSFEKTTPGTSRPYDSIDWKLSDIPDGSYILFAELIPGKGADGTERKGTVPRAGRNNRGDGTLFLGTCTGGGNCNVDADCTGAQTCSLNVDTNEIVASGVGGWIVDQFHYAAHDVQSAPVDFRTAGVQVGDQLSVSGAGGALFLRTITAISPNGQRLSISPAVTRVALAERWQVAKAGRNARLETWMVECIDADGMEWSVTSSLTQPAPAAGDANQDPWPHAITGTPYTSIGGEVTFTIVQGSEPFELGDMFTFTTTGITPVSAALDVRGARISLSPIARIRAISALSGPPPLTVELDATNSLDPNGETLSFSWTFGDGATASGPVVSHRYSTPGIFTVTLTATNPRTERSGEAQVDIVVINNSPKAVVTAEPMSGSAPLDVRFDGSNSSDLETDADPTRELIYQWDFGDGETANIQGLPGVLITTEHRYMTRQDGTSCTPDNPCTFNAALTVTDPQGKRDTDTVEIFVGNSLPEAKITARPTEGTAPLKVRFNADASSDDDNEPLIVTWDFDDPSDPNAPPSTISMVGDGDVVHTYTEPGTYHPSAVVKDGHPGGEATWSGIEITVSAPAPGFSDPRARFTIDPDPPVLNETFTVDASLSQDRPFDGGGSITKYEWDFGDGSATVSGTSPTATHKYTQEGDYTITLTVFDNEDPPNEGTTSRTVTVMEAVEAGPEENRPPVAFFTVNPPTGFAQVTVFTFNAGGSRDPDGDDTKLTYRWQFGDGSMGAGVEVSHRYDAPNSDGYVVRLVVRDEDGASTEATQQVIVQDNAGNRPPRAFIASGPRTGTAPVTLTFDGRNSFDPNGDPLAFRWEFKENGALIDTVIGAVVDRVFDQPGTFSVELEVSDGRGGVDRAGPETILVAAPGEVPPSGEQPERPRAGEEEILDSARQRPRTRLCGFGMLGSMFASLLGLTAMMATRRRAGGADTR